MKAKLLIYWSIYVLTLTYGHKLWVVTKRIRLQIQAAEMNFLQRVANHSLRNTVKSLLILHIERSQLRWVGYLTRMCSGRLLGEMSFRDEAPGQTRDTLDWEFLGVNLFGCLKMLPSVLTLSVFAVIPQLCENKNGGCEHFCNVTQGDAQCSCADGYFLASDGKSCHSNETFKCGAIITKGLLPVFWYQRANTTGSYATELNNSISSTEPHVQDADPESSVSENRSQNVTKFPSLEKLITSEIQNGSYHQPGNCPPGECPWQALLVSEDETGFCGGTILNENIILTAAHCMHQQHNFSVRLGRLVIHGNEVDHEVETILIHKHYSLDTEDNDIALIKLATPIKFTRFILPACIPEPDFAEKVLMHEPAGIVSGFGKLSEQEEPSTIMKRLTVPYVDSQTCTESIRFPITDGMFCAGYGTEANDPCQGDGGGPHVTRYRDTYFITGIVSWGEGCGRKGKYGVYTKVSKYIQWIHEGIKKLMHNDASSARSHT
uniref:Coagulation factor X n=1 Tax=Amphilophus citrinellus TaxID=61819 RepID=A0A3Q0RNY4_AMPCI